MYKKYHNMLQVVLAVSSSSGGQNKSAVYEEIKVFMQEDLFVGDRMVSNFL